jgi:hypothetical protein
MKYTITYLSDDGFKELKELNNEEFEAIRKTRDFILFYYGLEESFDIVRLNIYEFWKLYFETSEKYRLRIISRSDEIIKPISIFNQKLANILTSFRSYDDHLKRKINDSDLKKKPTLNYYHEKSSEVYNEYFSYRFFAKLRNYVQHYGFPISKIKYNSELVGDSVEFTISLVTLKNDLLKYQKWSHLKKKIEILDEEINIRKYLNEFLYALSFLHKVMRVYYLNYFYDSENKLNTIKDMCIEDNYKNHRRKPDDLIMINVNAYDESELKEMFWLPFSRSLDIRNYFGKNEFSEGIKKSYSINK